MSYTRKVRADDRRQTPISVAVARCIAELEMAKRKISGWIFFGTDLPIRLGRFLNRLARRVLRLLSRPSSAWTQVRRVLMAVARKLVGLKFARGPLRGFQNPLVTIVITVHNQSEEELSRCVNSVLNQTYRNIQLIIVDDGSTNIETVDFLREMGRDGFTDSSIEVEFIHQENMGLPVARNAGLSRAAGQYIGFLDPDDAIEPAFVEMLLFSLISSRNHRVALAHSDVAIVEKDTGAVHLWETSELWHPEILSRNSIPVTNLCRTEVLKNLGGFDEISPIEGCEDWEMWSRLAAAGWTSQRVRTPLFIYTASDTGMYRSRTMAQLPRIKKVIFEKNRHRMRQTYRRIEASLLAPQPRPENSTRQEVVFILPSLQIFGGSETFIRRLIRTLLAERIGVRIILTQQRKSGHPEAAIDWSKDAPIYDLSGLSRTSRTQFLSRLYAEPNQPFVFMVGFPLASSELKRWRTQTWLKRSNLYSIVYNTAEQAAKVIKNVELFTGVVAVYEALALALRQLVPAHTQVHRIYVGIEEDFTPDASAVNRSYSVPVFGWLGRLSKEKRPDIFFKLAEKVGMPGRFVMAGDGPLGSEVQGYISRQGNFEWMGRIEDIPSFMQSIDCLVITSDIEGIPNVALEALRLGTPIISTSVGGVSELIVEGSNGFLVPEEVGVDGLAECCVTLLKNDAKELRALQERTRTIGIPPDFLWEETARQYLNLLKNQHIPEQE